MTGLFYKDLKVCKREYIFVIVLQVIFMSLMIWTSVDSRNDLSEEVVSSLQMAKICICLLDLFLLSLLNSGVMASDEKKNWHVFINSVPDGKKLQIRSKYITIFMMYLLAVCWLLIADFITNIICNNQTESSAKYIAIFLCFMIIYDSFQIPFIIGFGAVNGEKIKTIFFTILVCIIVIYVLFGNIEPFLNDNVGKKINEFMKSGKFKNVFMAIPFVAAVIYWLSYRVSLLIYKKEGDRYEE